FFQAEDGIRVDLVTRVQTCALQIGTGTSGDQKLHGYDGDTGAVVYAGGGANELMAGTHSYSTTGIVARGRIYVATDNKVYAFKPMVQVTVQTNPIGRRFSVDGIPYSST